MSSNFDVVIIGAGITGTGVAYELSKKKLKIALIDKAPFPFQGASKANSGIIHAGYDDPPGSLRAKLVVRGNFLYSRWAEELGFDLKRPGSIVVAFNEEELETIKKEKIQGDERGVPGLKILGGRELFEIEPLLNREAIAGLYAPSAGVVCPMEVVSYLFKGAVRNGVVPFLNHRVIGFEKEGDIVTAVLIGEEKIHGEIVINASGVWGDVVSSMAGIDKYKIIPRKGEYILLDPNEKYMVNHILFPTPTMVSKGILVIPTITGDVLIGPTAQNLDDDHREDTFTTEEGLKEVIEKASHIVPSLSTKLTIKTFAGIRAQPNTNDFIIEGYDEPSNFINVIGIRSPGLTSAPAIAEYVEDIVEKKIGGLQEDPSAITEPFVKPDEVKLALSGQAGWGFALTPHLDSPSYPMVGASAQWGIEKEIYNFTCFTDKGLGVDLSGVFQNELIKFILSRGFKKEDVCYRFPGSWQVIEGKCGGEK